MGVPWPRRLLAAWMLALLCGELLIRIAPHPAGLLGLISLLHPWWYAPLPPLLGLALLGRRRRGLVALLLVATIWLSSYAGRWLTPLPDAGELRVLTWNVAGWNLDAADIDRVITAEQPDIIAFQELDEGLRRPLLARLADRYPYSEIRLPTEPGLQPADLGLFSRYPFDVSPLDCPYWRCYRRAVAVTAGGRALTLINVHIEHSPVITWHGLPLGIQTEREDRTIERLLADTAGFAGPLLIVGDFNTSERQPGYARLARRWGDSWRERGRGLGMTWPRTALTPPLLRIDYQWHSPELAPVAAAVGSGTSDHRYLVAAYRWR
jgi:vancomycin resistance protein VanJ